MVRVGTLPLRLLALEYGADLVYSPEIIDKKIIKAKRAVNQNNGTIDYQVDGKLVFRTHPSEKEKLILQIGSADASLALEAAKVVQEDVSGIDLNCGCPKYFSVHCGMGAALLTKPQLLADILQTLVRGLPKHSISAKIRLLEDKEETLELVRMISRTGIKALTVHCRTPKERPRDAAHYEWLPEIVRLCPFPVIANGDINHPAALIVPGISSFMLARAAQWNVSVFRKQGLLDPFVVSQEYLRYCLETENPFANTKYTLIQMWIDRPYSNNEFTSLLQRAKTYKDFRSIFSLTGR